MLVKHTIEDGMHIIKIFTPCSREDWRCARWPVSEIATSLNALFNGYFEACDWCGTFGAKEVAVTSTDAEALEEFSRKIDDYREADGSEE
ncbi:hypothetical protein [Paenibacillus sp. KN14-4R]|uniref:hypothetical protein n=1 Tax=Paenibacillus sp. KN14-4R TaxID=3445773 RepID=UPI003FA0EB8D